jgi:hypothetical protein
MASGNDLMWPKRHKWRKRNQGPGLLVICYPCFASMGGAPAPGGTMRPTLIVSLALTLAATGAFTVTAVAQQTPKEDIASQIRDQGYKCDDPQSAERDEKASRPDEAVWILTCEGATYRVRLDPDMAAKVERIGDGKDADDTGDDTDQGQGQ